MAFLQFRLELLLKFSEQWQCHGTVGEIPLPCSKGWWRNGVDNSVWPTLLYFLLQSFCTVLSPCLISGFALSSLYWVILFRRLLKDDTKTNLVSVISCMYIFINWIHNCIPAVIKFACFSAFSLKNKKYVDLQIMALGYLTYFSFADPKLLISEDLYLCWIISIFPKSIPLKSC